MDVVFSCNDVFAASCRSVGMLMSSSCFCRADDGEEEIKYKYGLLDPQCLPLGKDPLPFSFFTIIATTDNKRAIPLQWQTGSYARPPGPIPGATAFLGRQGVFLWTLTYTLALAHWRLPRATNFLVAHSQWMWYLTGEEGEVM